MTAAERVEKNTIKCHLVLLSMVLWFFPKCILGVVPLDYLFFTKKYLTGKSLRKIQLQPILSFNQLYFFNINALINGIYQMD